MTQKEEMKVRFRHLRKKDRTPVATMATKQVGNEMYLSFVFCSNKDTFVKKFARDVALERLNNLMQGKKDCKCAVKTTKEEVINFIEKTHETDISSSSGYLRLAKKMFEIKTRPMPTFKELMLTSRQFKKVKEFLKSFE